MYAVTGPASAPPMPVNVDWSKPILLTHFAQPIAAICWRGSCDDLWQLEQAVGHRGRTQAGPGQARQHRGQAVAPVEAVFELGEVAWHVLGSDRAVGPNDGDLDV